VPEDTGALARALAAMMNRTPEQIEAAQEMALKENFSLKGNCLRGKRSLMWSAGNGLETRPMNRSMKPSNA
jgi:hypothetical protein